MSIRHGWMTWRREAVWCIGENFALDCGTFSKVGFWRGAARWSGVLYVITHLTHFPIFTPSHNVEGGLQTFFSPSLNGAEGLEGKV